MLLMHRRQTEDCRRRCWYSFWRSWQFMTPALISFGIEIDLHFLSPLLNYILVQYKQASLRLRLLATCSLLAWCGSESLLHGPFVIRYNRISFAAGGWRSVKVERSRGESRVKLSCFGLKRLLLDPFPPSSSTHSGDSTVNTTKFADKIENLIFSDRSFFSPIKVLCINDQYRRHCLLSTTIYLTTF